MLDNSGGGGGSGDGSGSGGAASMTVEEMVAAVENGGGGAGGGEEERGKGGDGGNRWPREETLALLKIRADMDLAFRDATLKAPLWDEVSRYVWIGFCHLNPGVCLRFCVGLMCSGHGSVIQV